MSNCVQVDLHPSGKVMMAVQYFLEGGDTGKGNKVETFSTLLCSQLQVGDMAKTFYHGIFNFISR